MGFEGGGCAISVVCEVREGEGDGEACLAGLRTLSRSAALSLYEGLSEGCATGIGGFEGARQWDLWGAKG
jgi:hypothetical protein